MSHGGGFGDALGTSVQWLVIGFIALVVAPRLLDKLFEGTALTAERSARLAVNLDPQTAMDANLASAINRVGGYGW